MKIKFSGGEEDILKILATLQGETKAIRVIGNSIIIPTKEGAKQVHKGDTVIIDGETITIVEK